jgi:hypothetical protein
MNGGISAIEQLALHVFMLLLYLESTRTYSFAALYLRP